MAKDFVDTEYLGVSGGLWVIGALALTVLLVVAMLPGRQPFPAPSRGLSMSEEEFQDQTREGNICEGRTMAG